MAHETSGEPQPRLRSVLREDLRRGEFFESISRDYEDLREFYIDEARAKQLGEMHFIKRVLWTFGWLLKALFLKRSEEHTSELQSQFHLVCRLLLEKKKKKIN